MNNNEKSPSQQRVDEEIQTEAVIYRPSTMAANSNVNGNTLPLMTDIEREQINDEAHILISDFLNYRLRKAGFSWPDCPPLSAEPTRTCLVMRTLCDEFERRYSELFNDMTSSLQITPATGYQTFMNVCSELFRRNTGSTDTEMEIKWGRIVALYAFAGALAVQCVNKDMSQQIRNVAEWVTSFVRNYLSQWISLQGGWIGLCKFYEQGGNRDDTWSSFKKGMTVFGICGAVAGAVTLGALLGSRP